MADINDLPQYMLREFSDTTRAQVLWLYEAMRDQIRTEQLAPGQVVTVPELEHRFRVRPYVVVAALRLLRHDGLVETRPRLGTRVVVEGETWTVPDRDLKVPLAQYVEAVMRLRLADRVYPPGTRIPILALLAEEFGVSVATIRWGLKPLFDQGFLRTFSYKMAGTEVTERVSRTPRDRMLLIAQRPSHRRGTRYRLWGQSKTLSQWSRDERCKVAYETLKTRFITYGWPLEKAITTPTRGRD